ncbi:GMC oxidoreductase-domain-containing protein [Phellopilus nigrolimitatus]|nr:GMC oxidoreductase-domain-containing protein [Phellopilus nigrolimitatus]
MWSLGLLLATACCSAYASPRLDKRNIVANTAIKGSYDFVIVGGGTAGLVLASRLSEDSNHTVLVLEAGDTGDQVSERIDTPSEAYANGLVGTSYDWNYQTVSIPTAGNRVQTWPRGKVLGGSSAINGLYAVRPSQLEYDTWSSMLDGASGADVWNWANQLQRMKTSETFTSPSGAMASADTLEYSAASHGTNGPLDVSWPGYMLPVVGNWSSTLAANGIPTNADPYGGSNAGAFIALSALNPSNWTRSYSRAAYLDPLPPRSNLDVVVNQTVTRLIFNSSDSSNITATGVEFAQDSASARQTVTVNKEVIMAGGSIGTPNVLLHSGVGPSDVLQSAGVGVNLALPGVGQHLMDHISTGVSWTTTAETEAELRNAGDSSAVFLGFVNAAEAYINASTLLGANYSAMQQNVSNSMNTYAGTLVPSSDATVIAGYKAIYQVVADTFMPSALGHTELLLATNGQASGSQTIEIQVALQHPFRYILL